MNKGTHFTSTARNNKPNRIRAQRIRFALYALVALFSHNALADCLITDPVGTNLSLPTDKSPNIKPLAADYLECTTPVGQRLIINLEELGIWVSNVTNSVFFTNSEGGNTYYGEFGEAVISTSQQFITYTYNGNEFPGASEQINYTVVDEGVEGQQITTRASITITFTEAAVSGSPANPQRSMSSVVDDICTGNPNDLPDICTIFGGLSGNEPQTNDFLRAISPTNVSAMSDSAGSIAKQQLDNVRQRLTQIRLGNKGGTLQNLSIQFEEGSLDGPLLQSLFDGEQSGGGASADGGLVKPLSGFINGSLGEAEQDRSSNADGFELSNTNITAGLDYRVSNSAVVGAALGLSRADSDLTQDSGSFDVNGINLSLYGSYYLTPKIYLDSVLSVNQQDFDAQRTIQFNGGGFNVDEMATASTDNSVIAFSLESGYELGSTSGITTTMMLRLDYLKSTLDGYEENGAGQYDLRISERDTSEMNSRLGVQVVKALSQSWGVVLPQFDLHWVHEFEDETTPVTGSFADDSTGSTFELDTDANDRDYIQLSLGITSIVANGPTGFLQYSKTIDRDTLDEQQISLGMRFEF